MVDTAPRRHAPRPPAPSPAPAVAPQAAAAQIDIAGLREQLLGRWADDRRASRALALDPTLHKVDGLSLAEHRARVLMQCSYLVEHQAIQRAFPGEYGGSDNPGGNIAAFEELVTADPSLQIKAGVQWGLFGSAVMHLGTVRNHAAFLRGIIDLTVPGAFAMTETGHGSDVASIATTAVYDPETREFDIHTPFRAAWKDYLGNAALHGRAAVVFAQLVTGGINHGVHAFYTPIRDEDGAFLPGVGGEDDGLKGGLNGIDNGRLHFDHVRVPRENLLNRYGDVAEDGTYSSPIASPGRRFFTMLGTLVQGRVSLDGSAVVAQKIALQIALTYATQRRQFPVDGGEEQVLLDYGRHQRRLIPRLADVFAQSFAHEKLLGVFDDVFSGTADTEGNRENLETLAAAFKSLSTWSALDTLQEAREACGGAGFLAENRLTGLRADLDVFVTFEGDNTVLLQLVGKRLLTDYAKEHRATDAAAIARYVAASVGERIVTGAGLRRMQQTVVDRGLTARAVGALQDPESQRHLLTDRVETMVAGIAGRLRAAGKDKALGARLLNENQNELIEAARAHAELLQWEAFTDALADAPDAGTRTVLTWLRDLFGLGLVEKHLAWYLINGRLSAQRASALSAYIERLIARIRPLALDLVEAFGYEQGHVRAAIASGAEGSRQDEARAWFQAQAEAGTLPPKEMKPRR